MRGFILLFGLWCLSFVQANALEQKLLYLQYDTVPQRVYTKEIFGVRLKVLNLVPNSSVSYKFLHPKGVKILTWSPYRVKKGRYYYDTFYFKATAPTMQLPTIKASIKKHNKTLQSTTVAPPEIETITLNPKKDFCNIIAKDFQITKYKTTVYDQRHNIVVFSAEAKQTDIKDFKLQNVQKQGFESKKQRIALSKMIYYAVIDKKERALTFSYFNLLKHKYITLSIPIIVDDDRVTTQSDLKPKDQSKQHIKIAIASVLAFLALGLFIWKKKYYFLVFVVIPIGYIGYILMQQEQVCVKKNTKVTILPLPNSTVFEVFVNDKYVDKIGTTKGYIKIELKNKKIGWVSEEDICSY